MCHLRVLDNHVFTKRGMISDLIINAPGFAGFGRGNHIHGFCSPQKTIDYRFIEGSKCAEQFCCGKYILLLFLMGLVCNYLIDIFHNGFIFPAAGNAFQAPKYVVRNKQEVYLNFASIAIAPGEAKFRGRKLRCAEIGIISACPQWRNCCETNFQIRC